MKKILQYFSACPFSRSIILLLDELRLEYQRNEILDIKLLISKYHKQNTFYPIYEEIEDFENDNQIITQKKIKISSFLSINNYLIKKYSTHYEYLSGENMFEKSKIDEMIWWLLFEFYNDSFSIIIYEKYLKAFESSLLNHSPDSIKVRMAELKLKELLFSCDIKIKETGFCATESITCADLLLASMISILDYMDLINWNSNILNLKKWYLIMKSRPNFKNILKSRIFGVRPNQNYAIIDF